MDKDSALLAKRLSFLVVASISIGTMFYHFQEDLSWLDSLYFSVVTLTTVGYGDISPQTDLGKLFTIFYVIAGVGILGLFINGVAKQRVTRRVEKRSEGGDKKQEEGNNSK